MTPRQSQRFQIDYHGQGYRGVRAVPKGAQLPSEPLDDPWLVCALALERAMQGRFDLMPVLVDLYGATDDVALDHMCLGLLTDAGTSACFSRIVGLVEQTPDVRGVFDLCGALSVRGELACIPILLNKYLSCQGMREAERLPDFIGALIGDSLFPVDADDYEDRVMSSYRRMVDAFGDEKALVFQGERQGVRRLAKHILHNISSPHFSLQWKLVFESSTGRDCSRWYQGTRLQSHAVAVTLEAFLESEESTRYEDGVRYFFGHRIDAP